jgi:VWFA-related protein
MKSHRHSNQSIAQSEYICMNHSLPRRSVHLRISALALFVLMAAPIIFGQEIADTVKVRTRVVFLDALVKDKKSGAPVSDLSLENFQVLDNGTPRKISYFTREGQARKPLALVLVLDLRDDGAGRFLKHEEVRKAMLEQLANLPPGDEVAILAINANSVDDRTAVIRNGKALWLTQFTRDRATIESALARLPALIATPVEAEENQNAKSEEKKTREAGSLSVGLSSNQTKAPTDQEPKSDDVVEVETIKGKNGAVITRTTKKDGSVSIKRVSSSGAVVVELDDVYEIATATRDTIHFCGEKRPNSQAAIVWLSDGIAPMFKEDREGTQQVLIRSNAIFNSLTTDLRTLFKFLLPVGKPVASWVGISVYGSAKYFAQQSGGEAVRVNRTADYGPGLAKIIGNLTARYSLGFSLDAEEKDDGNMHELAVRVQALDAKGKSRKLQVSARRGYYMPKDEKDQAGGNK